MDEKQHDTFMKAYDHLQKRPGMYFASGVPAVANFMEGFKTAFLLFNTTPDFYNVFKEVAINRGWEDSPQAVWGQMQERGWDEDAIITELLEIYRLVFEKLIDRAELETIERKLNGKA